MSPKVIEVCVQLSHLAHKQAYSELGDVGDLLPKFSIITVCLNAKDTIEATITSVRSQVRANFEHIIIDGGSSDGTLEIINDLKYERLRVSTGLDAGLYDAMNKGVGLCSGDIVAFLNADDYYCRNDVLSIVAEEFCKPDIDAVCGAVAVISNTGSQKILRYYDARGFRPWMVRVGHMPPHPGFFAKRRVLDDVGKFNISFRTAADFDWMVRFFLIHKRNAIMIDKLLVSMRFGGQSQSVKGINLARRESIRILRSYGFAFPSVSIWLKYFLKLGSFLNRHG